MVIAHADHVSIFLCQDLFDLTPAGGADLWLVVDDTSQGSTPSVHPESEDTGTDSDVLPSAGRKPRRASPAPQHTILKHRSPPEAQQTPSANRAKPRIGRPAPARQASVPNRMTATRCHYLTVLDRQ